MTKYIHLAASVIMGVSAVVTFIKGDILLSNTNLILSILFLNWYKKEIKVSSNSVKRNVNSNQNR